MQEAAGMHLAFRFSEAGISAVLWTLCQGIYHEKRGKYEETSSCNYGCRDGKQIRRP